MKSVDREFMLERYRYILDQKKFLNKTAFVVVSIYQAGLILVIAAYYQLSLAAVDGKFSEKFISLACNGLMFLLWVVAFFCISLISSGVISWLGYRADEGAIEEDYLGGGRPLPNFSQLFRWYETYIVIGIFLLTIVFTIFLYKLYQQIA